VVGARRGHAEVRAPVGDERPHHLAVGSHELDGELPFQAGEHRRHERLGGRVARGEAHDVARALDAEHHLGDLVGGVQQPARMRVQPAPRPREDDAVRRAVQQPGADLRLQGGQALGQRRLRDVQPYGGAAEAPEVGGRAEAAQLGELGGGS
jgi:hypothetical protein